MSLSLHIIAKDEVLQVTGLIRELNKHVDEIVVAVDDKTARKELKKITAGCPIKILPYKWINDFSDKRNFVDKNCTSDYIMRLDCDDRLENPERLKHLLELAEKEKISIIYGLYDYSKDEWGNSNAVHYREIIYKNCDNLYWNKKIHENLLPKSTASHSIHIDDKIIIQHMIDHKHSEESYLRNVKYLLAEYNKDKEKTDPRTIAYLGRMLYSIGEYDKALFFLEKHINTSGWDEDRYVSWCHMSDIFLKKGETEQAIGAAFEALQEKPNYPEAFFKLHDIYQEKKDFIKAIYWGEEGFKKPIPKTFTLIDPSAYTWRPALSLSFCYLQVSEFEKAWKLFNVAKKAAPTLNFIVDNENLFRKGYEHSEYIKRLVWMTKYLEANEKKKIKTLLDSVPKELLENELVIKIRNNFFEPRVWDKDEVAIFCGGTEEDWSPKSVDTGIGGSEEAVINVANELTELGYRVTVFNNCGEEEGDYDGVKYLNYYKMNSKDKFNILFSWRMNIFMYGIEADNRIVWLHDMPHNIEWNEDTIKTFDKVITLSEYHKNLVPEIVPRDKIYVTTNGINPDQFINLDTTKVPDSMIYASSYNRGLSIIADNWDRIKKEVPNATIDVFYGWQVYDSFVTQGYVKDNGFKAKMQMFFDKEGVTEHGRIGHDELALWYAKSEVYAYPTDYAGEINCIALTKAIASDCNVITNDMYVLGERSPNAVSNDKFIDELIKTLKEKKSTVQDTKKYIRENSWKTVVETWEKDLLLK